VPRRVKKKCDRCGEQSLPGLTVDLCQYHYNERMWGKQWADEMLARVSTSGTCLAVDKAKEN
jgi:hypothetical protein